MSRFLFVNVLFPHLFSCVIIFSVTEREELFKETEDKIDETTKELRGHFYDLGLILFNNPEILPYGMGVSLLKASKEAYDSLREAREKKNGDEAFIKEYEERKEKKIKTETALEELREKEKETRLILGALIYEQCSLSLLPREKFSSVYDDSDREKELVKTTGGSSFFRKLRASSELTLMRKNDRNRYLDYSSFADDEENAVLITGEKAQNLVSVLMDIKKKREILSGDASGDEVFLTEGLSRYRSLEKGGIEDDKTSLEEKENAFHECMINYGNYLYDRGGTWIGENTPAEVLDIFEKILESQKEYARLNECRKQLEKEAEADDYKALIKSEKEKIRILTDEKTKIDMQIGEIEKEIERLENLLKRLFRNQDPT